MVADGAGQGNSSRFLSDRLVNVTARYLPRLVTEETQDWVKLLSGSDHSPLHVASTCGQLCFICGFRCEFFCQCTDFLTCFLPACLAQA